MSHFKAKMHQIQFLASVYLFVCVSWSLTLWL